MLYMSTFTVSLRGMNFPHRLPSSVAYLEINPLVCLDPVGGKPAEIYYLDMAAKLDQTADFLCGPKWAIARDVSPAANGVSSSIKADRGPPMVWPAPFGRDLTKEEAYIQKLDASTGASLKLTVLNASGRVWTMVAGGEYIANHDEGQADWCFRRCFRCLL